MSAVILDAPRLRVTEIFLSLQGESATVGIPTVFVRLTGCPLRCRYCDTGYAFRGGESVELDEVLTRITAFDTPQVTVTGGEPLAQPGCISLLQRLCDAGFRVSLETSGAIDVSQVDERVVKVMDLKTPGSGEVERNRYENIEYLGAGDEVKFVICDRADYDWARQRMAEFDLASRCTVLMSPSHGRQDARQLAEWVLGDRLPVRFQVQLHKILWGDEPGR